MTAAPQTRQPADKAVVHSTKSTRANPAKPPPAQPPSSLGELHDTSRTAAAGSAQYRPRESPAHRPPAQPSAPPSAWSTQTRQTSATRRSPANTTTPARDAASQRTAGSTHPPA